MREDDRQKAERVIMGVIVFGAVLLALISICSCTTTQYVPIETVRTEYIDNVREVHTTDSVVDTRFVYIKGDTVIDYRDRVKWKEKVVRDSIYIERIDSIQVPYPVEKPLTKWQKAKMDFGGMAIGGLLIAVCIAVVWLIRRFRR